MAKRKRRLKYMRDKDGKFASAGAEAKANADIKRAKGRIGRKQVKKALSNSKNSAGRRRITVAGGKSFATFVGGTKRSTRRKKKRKS